MDPGDRVVAHVHGVGAFRHHLDLKGIAKSRGLERLIPPTGTFDQCGPDWLRRAAIDVVDDGPYRLAHRGGRIDLLEPMTANELLAHRLAERGGIVHVVVITKAGP